MNGTRGNKKDRQKRKDGKRITAFPIAPHGGGEAYIGINAR